MGILDWFINRPAQFDPDSLSDELLQFSMDKAVSLLNPKIKLLRGWRERLAPSARNSIYYLRKAVLNLPPPVVLAANRWADDPSLRAFFAAADDVPMVLKRSSNLKTFAAKYTQLHEIWCVLDMNMDERQTASMSLQGGVAVGDRMQEHLFFAEHKIRICGQKISEVRRLIGIQAFEYLVAQALSEISNERAVRQGLEEGRAVLRARLRLLQQQGPGLGSLFTAAPQAHQSGEESQKITRQLLENERQMAALGSPQTDIENELTSLCKVLANPENYIVIANQDVCLNRMNAKVGEASGEPYAPIRFAEASLNGAPQARKAFILGSCARSDVLLNNQNALTDAMRYL